MGTNYSGLFHGTVGARNQAKSCNADFMHNEVTNWANKEAQKLESISKNKRRDFNTACIAIDSETGQQFIGRNGGIELNNTKKNSAIFGEHGVLPPKTLNRYPLGNCAEVDAINQALNAGAKMENIYISTIHTYKGHVGEPKEACENCTEAFKNRIKGNHTGWKF